MSTIDINFGNSLYGEYDTNQHFHYTVTIQLNQGVKTLFGT